MTFHSSPEGPGTRAELIPEGCADLITGLRHTLHRNAELSGAEHKTKAILMDFLRAHTDFTVTDRGAWFYAFRGAASHADNAASTEAPAFPATDSETPAAAASETPAAKPPIAIRADMDALPIPETCSLPYASEDPAVSHRCGHDGHSAALCGLALALTGQPLPRDVYLIFQHAEETGAGARVCAGLLSEKGIREIYAFHNLNGYPPGRVVLRRGQTQPASGGRTISFTGAPAHASAPEHGKSPARAVAELCLYINELLQRPRRGMLLATVVNLNVGTKDFGVAPGTGELSVTERAEYEEEMDALDQALCEKARQLAARDGLTVSFSESDRFPATVNDDSCICRVMNAAVDVTGVPAIEMDKMWRASEDFGWYTKRCPGAIFYIGSGEDYPALHTEAYDFPDEILPTAVQMFRALIIPAGGTC